MNNPYRIPAEKPVIRRIYLTEEELKKAIMDFIDDNNLLNDWVYGDPVEYAFCVNDTILEKDDTISVQVSKTEKIDSVKYY